MLLEIAVLAIFHCHAFFRHHSRVSFFLIRLRHQLLTSLNLSRKTGEGQRLGLAHVHDMKQINSVNNGLMTMDGGIEERKKNTLSNVKYIPVSWKFFSYHQNYIKKILLNDFSVGRPKPISSCRRRISTTHSGNGPRIIRIIFTNLFH